MEITRKVTDDLVVVELAGRVDSYWSDHLSSELTEVVGEGRHHIRVDCSRVSFLSSAGIGVLMSFHRELGEISGSFQVVNASPAVVTVLRVTRLDTMLIASDAVIAAPAVRERPDRSFESAGAGFDVFDLDAAARLTCRAIGHAAPLAGAGFAAGDCRSLGTMSPTLVVGVGAFGSGFGDCQARFGELISVAGATAYQPGDGTNVADYLVATGPLAAEIQVLYCLACEGRFSHLLRFEALQPGSAVGLANLLAGCLSATSADALGIVIVAEAAGLVGAALRRSPVESPGAGGFFDHPAIRKHLSFTAERAFARSVALVAGVVSRTHPTAPLHKEHLRPIGRSAAGHLHAAAFRFRPIRKGHVELGDTVSGLFEDERLLGVMHLLNDDRGAGGAGESELVRGACWIAPIAGDWMVS